jgi:hypothetical protein
MEKTSEKSIQIYQPRWQTFFRSMQDTLLPNRWGSLVSFPLRIFPGWADIQRVARRTWLQRLPAVITAALLLYAFMSIVGIGQAELVLASFIALAGLGCFIIMEGIR